MENALYKYLFYYFIIFGEMHVKWSVTLTDRMGPEILTVLRPDQHSIDCVAQGTSRLESINL